MLVIYLPSSIIKRFLQFSSPAFRYLSLFFPIYTFLLSSKSSKLLDVPLGGFKFYQYFLFTLFNKFSPIPIIKRILRFFHQPLGTRIYFPHIFLVSLKSPYSVDVPFGCLNFANHQVTL
jgi:hypothetical protein